MHCLTNNQYAFPSGAELLSIDTDYEWRKPQTEAIIWSHFRNFVFAAVYSPRVLVEPYDTVAAMLEDTLITELDKHGGIIEPTVNLVSEELAKYPVLEKLQLPLKDRPTHPLFDGFFSSFFLILSGFQQWVATQTPP